MGAEREVLELDAVIVGAGPAGLAAAYHLQRLIQRHNEDAAAGRGQGPDLSEAMIAVLEKGAAAGDHVLSGAVMDPRGLAELMPDFEAQGCPGIPCVADDVYYLTRGGKIRAPFVPRPLRNEGNRILSLNEMVRWLNGKVEELGVQVFASFPAAGLLVEEGKVRGVTTGDKGVDRNGGKKPNFEPGMDVRAKVTILAEGARGSLTKKLVNELGLCAGRNPQVYATCVKELWRVKGIDEKHKGRVIHTLGFPLDRKTYGGGFIYFPGGDQVVVGFATGLDYADPTTDPHACFQQYKTHPFLKELLAGGEMIRYGAKTIPEGGYWSRPKSYASGCLIAGDCGSNLNPSRLKGVHTAIKTGMLAAEAAFRAIVSNDSSEAVLGGYEDAIQSSWVKEELFRSRNFHQAFDKGMPLAILDLGLQLATGGRGLRDRYALEPGHTRMRRTGRAPTAEKIKPDGTLTFDKLTDVYRSGTTHEEDQPCHLVVTVAPDHCSTTCADEYGNPCQHFCPAAVYEMVEAPERADGRRKLRINASNCVHCKTCDVMDPYQVIEWRTPEGGGGPVYAGL
ncbi:MAG: electron transfer flavoprotein-ubiquinone oxidoreductase [Planctomycetes bacterium]|nr:electron transfer flavoprotein-ubiquinone oxidoreductase [Planctomycetota bacterium]